MMCIDLEMQIMVLASRDGMQDCKAELMPMPAQLHLARITTSPHASMPFRELVGARIWEARRTHLEITSQLYSLCSSVHPATGTNSWLRCAY